MYATSQRYYAGSRKASVESRRSRYCSVGGPFGRGDAMRAGDGSQEGIQKGIGKKEGRGALGANPSSWSLAKYIGGGGVGGWGGDWDPGNRRGASRTET